MDVIAVIAKHINKIKQHKSIIHGFINIFFQFSSFFSSVIINLFIILLTCERMFAIIYLVLPYTVGG